jgi:cell cycle checkpoint protein
MIKLFILLIVPTDHESLMTNFIEYLTRSLRHDRTFQNTVNTFSGIRRKVILIDDIPDLSNGSSRKRFQNFMRGICGNTDTHVPVILTLTTIEESRGHEPGNGFKKRTYDFAESGVIPADIVESRFCTRIQQVFISHTVIKVLSLPIYQCYSTRYTPVTPKKLAKIIKSIYDAEAPQVPIDFDAVAEISNGDIRSAINNLQFYAIPKQGGETVDHLMTR